MKTTPLNDSPFLSLRCRSLNNGRPLYLCGDCEIAMHSHPALRGHDVRPVFLGTAAAQMPEERNFPEDMSMMRQAVALFEESSCSVLVQQLCGSRLG